MAEDNKYPNLEPPEGGVDDMGKIRRVKAPQIYEGDSGDLPALVPVPIPSGHIPQIAWGEEYKTWPIERRLRFAEKLASSMNHAADILQQERNHLLEVVAKLEAQLKSGARSYVAQGALMHKELGNADAEKQILYQEIVDLKKTIKELKIQVKRLEAAGAHHD